jgi:hypothetical protein
MPHKRHNQFCMHLYNCLNICGWFIFIAYFSLCLWFPKLLTLLREEFSSLLFHDDAYLGTNHLGILQVQMFRSALNRGVTQKSFSPAPFTPTVSLSFSLRFLKNKYCWYSFHLMQLKRHPQFNVDSGVFARAHFMCRHRWWRWYCRRHNDNSRAWSGPWHHWLFSIRK